MECEKELSRFPQAFESYYHLRYEQYDLHISLLNPRLFEVLLLDASESASIYMTAEENLYNTVVIYKDYKGADVVIPSSLEWD
jgi:hypothetical protein